LRRGEQRMPVEQPVLLLAEGLVVTEAQVAPLYHFGAWPMIQAIRGGHEIRVPVEQIDELLRELASMPNLPRINIPEEFGVTEARPAPVRHVMLARRRGGFALPDRLGVTLSFDYDGHVFQADERDDARLDRERRRLIRRDR